LVEIPTLVEYLDNIVAYWQPKGGLTAGASYHYEYRMHWGPSEPEAGRIVAVTAGRSVNHDDRVFVLDFAGARQNPELAANPEQVRIHARTSAGQITGVNGTLVQATGHYRAYVRFAEGDAELAEFEVFLEVSGEPWGELWRYRWTP
jgi:glucans biosynthesis protein